MAKMPQSQHVKSLFQILQLLIQLFNSPGCSYVSGFQFQRPLNLLIESFLRDLQLRRLSAQYLREVINFCERDRMARLQGFCCFLALQKLMQARFQCLYVS